MADEHFLPGRDDFFYGLGGAPFLASYAPLGLDAAAAMQGFGMAWAADLQLPADSSAATTIAHFDSALSSLVSSPAHNGSGDDVAIGDLIGRLGSICNAAAPASASNSCYSTPLSSPPRGASSSAAFAFRGCYPGGAAALEAGTGRLSRVASSKSLGAGATPPAVALGSPEVETRTKTGESTEAPEQMRPAKGNGGAAARKRKASGKGKASTSATTAVAAANASPKRTKVKVAADGGDDTSRDEDAAETATKEDKPEPEPEPEPAKGYIHVRARRGQATDSHSLAERVRRERISERMKMLQSLVPGCNKITGKALMLDEIINYVQSLQRQVEFLSMKLATLNPELDLDAHYHQQLLPSGKDMTMMHQAAAMLACPTAAFFSSYPGSTDPFVAVHPTQQLDSCASSSRPGCWETQDLQSILRHDSAVTVRGGHHDLLYASPAPQPHHNSFHGQQQQQQQDGGAATVSHMKLEQP